MVAFKVVVRAVSPFRTPVIVPSAAFGDVPGAVVTAADKDDGDSDRAAWNQWPVAAAKNGDERILRGVLRLFPFSESDGKGLRSLFRGAGSVRPLPASSSGIMTTSTRLEVLEGMSGMGFFWWGSMVGELK